MTGSMTTDSTWNFDDSIESDPVVGIKLIDQMVSELENRGWTEKEVFGIHMSLEEAIINAIKHGNKEASDKRVSIQARIGTKEFYICVTDEGEGFDPDDVPDPTLDENLEIGSGRGLMLMKHYMDSVQYNDVGNSLELSKARAAN